MLPSRNQQMKRVGALSRAHVIKARESCEDGARHVRDSRLAVQRSFQTLAEPFCRGVPLQKR